MTSPLLAPILLLPILAAATLLGSQLLRRLHLAADAPPGLLLFESATGLLLIGLALAAAGLLGHLTAPVAVGILLAAALIGLPGSRALASRVGALGDRLSAALGGPGGNLPLAAAASLLGLLLCLILFGTGAAGLGAAIAALIFILSLAAFALWRPEFGVPWLLLAWCLITLGAALAPPAGGDYDGLAEHLAQAKIYARTARFAPLWYDHHSQFPALTEMLFTLGMLFNGPALAKLFHWAFGMLALGACWVIAERFLRRGAGKWAALMFASTPLISWLMQAAYVDLAATAYGLLAVLAFLHWRRPGQTRGLALAGLMAGGMMGAKMQGIALVGVLLAAVALAGCTRRHKYAHPFKALATFAIVAAVVAGPWYVKTWLLTGNPVYPFAYGIFGGKTWGVPEARAYQYEQKEFGADHLPPVEQYWQLSPVARMFVGPRAPLNLLLAPWNLTFNPVPFTARWREGPRALLPALLTSWIGPLYLLGLVALLGLWVWGVCRAGGRTRPQTCAPPAVHEAAEGAGHRSADASDRASGGTRSDDWAGHRSPPYSGPAVLLWLFLPLWLWWLMTMQLDRYLVPALALLAPATGFAWARLEATLTRALPVLWMALALATACYISAPALAVVSGMVSQDQYLRATCEVYEPSVLINKQAPPEGKIILFGEPRGFYLDRDYLWGDPGHHRLIPYEQLKTPEALIEHLRRMGITHALINMAQTGGANPGPPISLLYEAVEQGLAHLAPDEPTTRREYLILDLRP